MRWTEMYSYSLILLYLIALNKEVKKTNTLNRISLFLIDAKRNKNH